jgi:hypothetical protein
MPAVLVTMFAQSGIWFAGRVPHTSQIDSIRESRIRMLRLKELRPSRASCRPKHLRVADRSGRQIAHDRFDSVRAKG